MGVQDHETGKADDADRADAKLVHSCWIAFYKMNPNAKSLTCANGVAWPAYTEAGDDVMQFTAQPKLVKSQTLADGPPRQTSAGR